MTSFSIAGHQDETALGKPWVENNSNGGSGATVSQKNNWLLMRI